MIHRAGFYMYHDALKQQNPFLYTYTLFEWFKH